MTCSLTEQSLNHFNPPRLLFNVKILLQRMSSLIFEKMVRCHPTFLFPSSKLKLRHSLQFFSESSRIPLLPVPTLFLVFSWQSCHEHCRPSSTLFFQSLLKGTCPLHSCLRTTFPFSSFPEFKFRSIPTHFPHCFCYVYPIWSIRQFKNLGQILVTKHACWVRLKHCLLHSLQLRTHGLPCVCSYVRGPVLIDFSPMWLGKRTIFLGLDCCEFCQDPSTELPPSGSPMRRRCFN